MPAVVDKIQYRWWDWSLGTQVTDVLAEKVVRVADLGRMSIYIGR
jgi:hypothetical protein